MAESKKIIHLLMAGAVLMVPVTPQQAGSFPSRGASLGNQQAQASGFYPSQSRPFQLGRNQPAFSPASSQLQQRPASFNPQQQSTLLPRGKNTGGVEGGNGGGEEPHTYADGSMGGDYPAHKAAQEAAAKKNSGMHTYADGSTGGNYPAHKAAQELQKQQQLQQQNRQFSNGQFSNNVQPQQAAGSTRPGTHTYPNGMSGENYPAHKAAQEKQQQLQQQQQQQNRQFSNGQFTNFQPQQAAGGSSPGTHTYEDGSMGGDYPAHKAAQEKQQQQQQQQSRQFSNGQFVSNVPPQQTGASMPGTHTYADGSTGGNYPAHKAAQELKQQQQQQNRQFSNGQSTGQFVNSFQPLQTAGSSSPGTHTYADGTTGGDYPAHKAAQELQKQQQQQQQQNRQFSNGQFVNNVQPQQAAASSPGTHTYADGSTGGDYPAHKAAQEKQQQRNRQFSGGQFKGNFQPVQTASTNPGTHTYADGQTGENYPAHKAAQEQQLQQQQQQQQNRQFSNGQFVSSFQPKQTATSHPGTHTYADGQTGENYPAHKAAQEKQQHLNFQSASGPLPGNVPVQLIGTPQQSNTLSRGLPQPKPLPRPLQGASATFNPTASQGRNLLAQTGQGQGHTYADGSSGGDYPTHLKAQQQGQQGSTPGTSVFQPRDSLGGLGSGRQCFQYRNLADSYHLSDVLEQLPNEDDIMSELRANPHMGPMLGFERLPQSSRRTSPFSSFDSSLSFGSLGFQDDNQVHPLTNVKHFPANFDQDTLGQNMRPTDQVCPSDPFTLRQLTIDKNRCSVINANYQAVTFTKCKRRECNMCGAGPGHGQGVSACVDTYNWVSVTLFCPHWQRDHRIKTVRLYLPQGCTCNTYQC